MYKIVFTKKAVKDLLLLEQKKQWKAKVLELIEILKSDPFQTPPFFERLGGDLDGVFSRRINIKDRLVYTVNGETVLIHSIRSHYKL